MNWKHTLCTNVFTFIKFALLKKIKIKILDLFKVIITLYLTITHLSTLL